MANEKLIMNVINKLVPTYEISNISTRFAIYLLNNYDNLDSQILTQ